MTFPSQLDRAQGCLTGHRSRERAWPTPERMLRDVALVLHLTQSVKKQIVCRAAAQACSRR